MKEGVLSDGTIVPPGWTVGIVNSPFHQHPSVYPNPDTFDPFRFSKLRMEADSDVKYGFTTLDNDYITFGMGRHACPGRFLCVNLHDYFSSDDC
jgi:cytochrome P450